MRSQTISCPNCLKLLNSRTFRCENGHEFFFENGVLRLLNNDFGEKLSNFTKPFTEFREKTNRRLQVPLQYPHLPFIDDSTGEATWKLRRYDLEVIEQILSDRPCQRILDVGAWNGWLSNRLTLMGNEVTAVDYFVDEFDGLGAKKFYETDFSAIQMDLEDLSVFTLPFDVVVLNRCLQFFLDPIEFIAMVLEIVSPGGLLLLTGLTFLRDPRERIQSVKNLRAHLNHQGFDFFKPIRGYLDFDDKGRLESMGINLKPYPQLRLANLKSYFLPKSPRHFYGIYARDIL